MIHLKQLSSLNLMEGCIMADKEDRKNVVWTFDQETGIMSVDTDKSNRADLEKRFSFKLEVYGQ